MPEASQGIKSNPLWHLITTEMAYNPVRTAMVAAVAGLGNAMVLAIVNSAAQHAEDSQTRPLYAVAFVAVMAIYITAQRWILRQTANQVEAVIHRLRMRIINALKECELLEVDQVGRATIHAALTAHTQTLSQSAPMMAIMAQMFVLVVFTALYIGFISPTALIALLISLALIIMFLLKQRLGAHHTLMESLALDTGVHSGVDDLLDGLREAKLSRRKTNSRTQRIEETSAQSAGLRSSTQLVLGDNFVFSQAAFYLLLAVMVFVVPLFTSGFSDVVQKSTTAVLFIIGPISGIISSQPMFENAAAAATSILDLEKRLLNVAEKRSKAAAEEAPPPDVLAEPPAFEHIELSDALFRFGSQDGDGVPKFVVGPINLKIERGEILFITGGNGSGKSTLMHMLLGLYPLSEGHLKVDGKIVPKDQLQSYRELFSVVFGDSHLSQFLDGVAPEALAEADYWRDVLEIRDKTDVIDGAFTTVNLSAGQKKRLHLLTVILERRPIIVLDEWAADQDPVFRRKFYREILPMLQKRGHTIVAVSHDNRFFDASTRQIHVEEGRIGNYDPEVFGD